MSKLRQSKKRRTQNDTVERLRQLRIEHGLTLEAFALACGAPKHTTAMAWLNGVSLPSAVYLKRIAERFGITIDWLLGVEGASKTREQSRNGDELQNDVAAYVARRVAVRLSTDVPGVEPGMLEVDGAGVLSDAVVREYDNARDNFGRLFEAHRNAGDGIAPKSATIRQLLSIARRLPTAKARREIAVEIFRMQLGLADVSEIFARSNLKPRPERLAALLGPSAGARMEKLVVAARDMIGADGAIADTYMRAILPREAFDRAAPGPTSKR